MRGLKSAVENGEIEFEMRFRRFAGYGVRSVGIECGPVRWRVEVSNTAARPIGDGQKWRRIFHSMAVCTFSFTGYKNGFSEMGDAGPAHRER